MDINEDFIPGIDKNDDGREKLYVLSLILTIKVALKQICDYIVY